MKLLTNPNSPFARKVRVLIREIGLVDSVEEVDVATMVTAPDADVVAANPTGRIPVLIRDDGRALWDSRVICRYLDDVAEGGMYPAARFWDVLQLEATADGMSDSAAIIAYEMRQRPEDKQWIDWQDGHWAKIARALAALESDPSVFAGRPVDMGQIALGSLLGYLDLRHGARNWRDGVPQVADWFATFSERPAMRATKP